MSETKCIKVYQFDELSDEAKDKAREWMREAMSGDEFYAESVIEDAKNIGKLMGIDISNVYYSGFYSQGDGACFEGSYAYVKGSAKAVRAYAPEDTELHRIASELAKVQKGSFYGISGKVRQSGHYSHSGCTTIDLVKSDNQGYENELPQPINDAITELLRDYMDWIYKMLRTEYEYQNADEQIDETIRANEYGFTEGGSRRITL